MPLGSKFSDYQELTPRVSRTLAGLKGKLRGLTVLHLNSTPLGGGVAELLRSQVPLERSLGMDSRWISMEAPPAFFTATKKIHNLLQGKPGNLTEAEKSLYLETGRKFGESVALKLKRQRRGIVVIHDPQPLAAISALSRSFVPVLRLHLDLSTPNQLALEFLRPLISKCLTVVLSNREYAKALPWASKRKIKVVYPAINPFTSKNREMSRQAAEAMLTSLGINCAHPILSQISRLDPWKDPVGVIQAYYRARNKVPDLELVLAGLEAAQDDPEAIMVAEKVKKHAHGDPHIHLFAEYASLRGLPNDDFINALYTASTVVMQKSLREGFGLTVTEAMWKGKAVVGGRISGIGLQIRHGKNGILVSSPEEAARAVVRLVKDEKLRERLGRAAKRSVQKRFLLSRLLLDHAKLYLSLKSKSPR